MEIEDKSMERQKLVQDEEEELTLPTSATTQSKTPISPPNVGQVRCDNFTHPKISSPLCFRSILAAIHTLNHWERQAAMQN